MPHARRFRSSTAYGPHFCLALSLRHLSTVYNNMNRPTLFYVYLLISDRSTASADLHLDS
jgi:hypothetical protein